MSMKDKVNKLCVIAPKYPTAQNPVYTFVDQLVCALVDNGIECSVISPYSITQQMLRNTAVLPRKKKRITKNNNAFYIYSPRYISLSRSIFNIKTSMYTYKNFKNAVIQEYKKRSLQADAVYGHFIYPSGMCAADLGEMFDIPSFLAYGESSPALYNHITKSVLQEKLKKLKGIISVSSENKRELLDTGLMENGDIISVFPNAIDESKFFKINKNVARKRLGIDGDKFVVAFVGHFIERKGVAFLSNALNQVEDVYSVFIGAGSEEPQCKNILFKGRVCHEQVHIYMNAVDVFVLPTQAEGCSNAIVEAMACGLPVISSDQPFNDDILSTENAIRLDVQDVEALQKAILLLRDNPALRRKMSNAALLRASSLNITQRAKNIIAFMESRMREYKLVSG